MKKQSDEILLCKLDVLLMPSGEVLCEGKSIGYFKDIGQHLTPYKGVDGTELTEEQVKQLTE